MKKNLTDDEIVQTFENCINGKCKGDCAYRTTKERCDMKQLHRDALDLLQRRKTRIEQLEEARDYWREAAATLGG